METTFYRQHLNFEETPDSKEFQLNKCNCVLGLIARFKDRNRMIREDCEMIYGRNENGKIKASQTDLSKYNMNLYAIKRLQSYYNNLISKIEKF